MKKSIFPIITSCTIAKETWTTLKDGYQGSDQLKQIKLQNLKIVFENLKMNEGENVGDYYIRVKSCVNKIKNLGEEVKTEVILKKVLRYLLSKWNHVAIIIEESKDPNSLDYDHLIGSLMSYEKRI